MEIIGWSLLHSVWQGALVALVMWGVLRAVRHTTPRVRYATGVLALAALLALPVVTYRQTVELWAGHRTWLMTTAERIIEGRLLSEGRADAASVEAELRRRHATVWSGDTGTIAAVATEGRGAATAFAWFWLAGVVLLSGRLVVDMRRARRLTEGGRVDERWRRASRDVAERMGVTRPVRVRVTDRVDVPALVGWRWPVILVPPAARELTGPAMEAILAHELAHVRRNDYVANLVQSVAEVLLFYNPAAWWISARIREERECSCDQSAIPAVTGGPADYLRALLALETGRSVAAGALALNGGPLLRRIRRIHGSARDARVVDWRNLAAVLLLTGVGVLAVPSPHPPVAARVSATSLMLQDLDRMRVVMRTVSLPPGVAPLPQAECPEEPTSGREV